MPAAPIHHTAVDKTSPWDGPAAEKVFDKLAGDFVKFYAWVDKGESDSDADGTDKEDGWGPHHDVNSKGVPGAANLKGVEAAMAALNGAHGGSSRIPASDRAAVHAHLAAHYKDAGLKAPELKSAAKFHASARAELRNVPENRYSTCSEFELREVPNGTGGTNLRFTGFASVTEAEYEMEDPFGTFIESVSKGAFTKTLGEKCDVAFLCNHQGLTLARTRSGSLKLSEVTDGSRSPIAGVTGLHYEALLDPENLYVQAMRSGVERGDLDECSFAFRVTRQEWNADYTRRWINEVDMNRGDVSIVNFGANPATAGTVSLRQRRPGDARLAHFVDGDRDYLAARARLAQMELEAAAVSVSQSRAQIAMLRLPPRRNPNGHD